MTSPGPSVSLWRGRAIRTASRAAVAALAACSAWFAGAAAATETTATPVARGAAHDAAIEAARAGGGAHTALPAAAILRGRGDAGTAADLLARAIEVETDEDLRAGAVAALSVLVRESGSGGHDDIAPRLERVANAGTDRALSNPEARSIALLTAADLRLRDGEREAALATMRERGGRIEEWTLVGPYGRFSRLGFDRAFPPESGTVEPGPAVAAGALDPPHAIVARFDDGRVTVPPSMLRPGVAYAAVDVVVERETGARLRVSSPASFRVFLDGRPILEADRDRGDPPTALDATLRLGRGTHRLVLKLPANVADAYASVGLVADVAEAGAGPAPRTIPARGTASEFPPSSADAHANPLDERLPSRARESRAHALAAWWWLRARGLDTATGRLLDTIDRSFTGDPMFDLLAGEYWLGARTGASAHEDLSLARTRFEAALASAPDLLLAEVLIARMDLAADRVAEAWDRLAAALARDPEHAGALALAHEAAAARGWLTEAAALLDRALAVRPDDPGLLGNAIELAGRRGSIASVADLAARLSARQLHQAAHARSLTAAGRTGEAVLEWRRLADARPTVSGPWRDLLRTLIDAGRDDEARAALDDARPYHPGASWVHESLADLEARGGNEEGARRHLRAALAAAPSRIGLRRALIELGDEDRLRPHLGDAERILAEAGGSRHGADSSLLADIAAVRIDAQGGQTELYQGLHKVYTRAGVEHEGEIASLPGAEFESIRIFKADGRVVDVAPGARRPVSLPGLEPGDAFETVWQRYIAPLGGVPGALDNRTLFIFEAPDREYVLSRFVVAHDADLPVEVCGTFDDLEIGDRLVGGERVRSFTARRRPRQRVEPHVANRLEVTAHVRLGLGLDWTAIGDRLRDAFVGQLRPDAPLPELADEVRRRAGPGDPRRLAEALVAVVQERIRPGGSALSLGAPASSFASAGEGNRTGIALALARIVGLDASLLLARPIESRGLALDCPSPDAFGYALLRIDLPGGPVHADLGAADLPLDVFPSALSGSDALHLPLDPAVPVAIVDVPRREPGVLREQRAQLSVDADGRVSGELVIALHGEVAAETRRVLAQVPTDRLPFVHRSIASSVFPGAEVAGVSVSGTDGPEQPLAFDLDVERGALARRSGTGFAIPLTTQPLGLLQEYAPLASREFPLLLDARLHQKEITRIALPEGLRVAEPPAPVRIEGEFGSYSLDVRIEDGAVVVERVVHLPHQRIEPGRYDAFRELALAIDAAERREMRVLIDSPALAAPRSP